jgi:[glutamine synthetase] adenylyltransferase / [glutamine synthetase]-adenylyl-L-tyrosine phosphorylase
LLEQQEQLPAGFAEAQNLLTRFLIILRLVAPDLEAPPPPAQRLIAECLSYADWPDLMAAVENARGIVLKEYQRILGPHDSV